jgi:drug/metabolite transporter (DMT)-like permease
MRRTGFVLAFLAIYVIWGSTYFAIRVAVDSIPPLAMMGARCLAAGLILLAWSRRSAATLDAAAWRAAFVAGGFLFLLSHGSLAWAEQRVPSGVAALLGATTPLWLALVDWRWGTGHVPGWCGRAGLAVGFAGVALLVAPEWSASHAGTTLSSIAVVGASLAWAAGAVYGRGAALPRDVRLSTAVQLLAGAVWLAAASLAAGEWRGFSASRVTGASVAALIYLVVFGSVIAFTAYVWLMRTTTAAVVGTHAYVNPVVAVALGAAWGGERLTVMTLVSAITIVGGVILVLVDRRDASVPANPPAPEATRASHAVSGFRRTVTLRTATRDATYCD